MLVVLPPIAVALPDKPELLDSITYQLVGLFVVFAALGSIWFLMEVMGRIFARVDQRAETVAAAAAGPSVLPTEAEIVPPAVIAVITAAAVACLKEGEHIVAIHPVEPAHDQNLQLLAWSSEGRRQIFASHKLR